MARRTRRGARKDEWTGRRSDRLTGGLAKTCLLAFYYAIYAILFFTTLFTTLREAPANDLYVFWHIPNRQYSRRTAALGTVTGEIVSSVNLRAAITQQPEREFTSGLVCVKAPLSGFHAHQSACELSLGSLSYSRSTLPKKLGAALGTGGPRHICRTPMAHCRATCNAQEARAPPRRARGER